MVIAGRITDKESDEQLDALNIKKQKLQDDLQRLEDYLQKMPNPKTIKNVAKMVNNKLTFGYSIAKRRAIAKNINTDYDNMTYEQKRALVETVFSGERPDGTRMGVYVTWKNNDWKFSIHGHFININDMTPITNWDFSDNAAHDFHRITKYASH